MLKKKFDLTQSCENCNCENCIFHDFDLLCILFYYYDSDISFRKILLKLTAEIQRFKETYEEI